MIDDAPTHVTEEKAMTTEIARMKALEFEAQVKKGWPLLVFIFALTSYAGICLVGLLIGMTYAS
jgi:hypothetical protein